VLLPHTRAKVLQEVTLLGERLASVAEQMRAIAAGLIRMGRTIARVIWLYNVARQASRHRDLEHAVLDAIDAPPLLHLRRPHTQPVEASPWSSQRDCARAQ
jgi:hypothetical protein